MKPKKFLLPVLKSKNIIGSPSIHKNFQIFFYRAEKSAIASLVAERNAHVSRFLESSKDEVIILEENDRNLNREKRLFFNLFAMSTTITTYQIATVMQQRPIKLLVSTTSDLSCLPGGFKLCT